MMSFFKENTIRNQSPTLPISLHKQSQQLVGLKQLQIDALSEMTTAISSNQGTNDLFKIYGFILMAQMGVSRLAAFYKDRAWSCVNHYGVSSKEVAKIQVAEHLLQYKGTAILDQKVIDPLKNFKIIIPVYHKDKPLAFLLLSELQINSGSTEEKLRFVQTLSNVIVVAIENKRLFKKQVDQEKLKLQNDRLQLEKDKLRLQNEKLALEKAKLNKELQLANEVQSMLIPKHLPNNQFVDMAGFYLPHQSIGGDYYDYIQISKNEFVTCMADVSGKGVAAALIMAHAQALLRSLVKETRDLKELVKKLNTSILEVTNGYRFITLFLARHNLKDKTITYINAGHNPPLLMNNNKIQLLNKGCTILGALDFLPTVEETTIPFTPNTFIITYTDGVTDVENEEGDFFEMERLQDFVTTNHHLPIQSFNDELILLINQFKGNQIYTDDISILTYRIH